MHLNPNQNRNLNHDVSWPVAAHECHLGSGPRGRRAHSAHCAHSEIAECAQRLAPCTWKTPTPRAHRVVHLAHRAGAFLSVPGPRLTFTCNFRKKSFMANPCTLYFVVLHKGRLAESETRLCSEGFIGCNDPLRHGSGTARSQRCARELGRIVTSIQLTSSRPLEPVSSGTPVEMVQEQRRHMRGQQLAAEGPPACPASGAQRRAAPLIYAA